MKQKITDDVVIFGTGAFGYGLIEIFWRGTTHPSMLFAGGASLVLLGQINRRMSDQPLLYRCIAGSSVITTVELAIGSVCNLGLGMNIWDYSAIPFNFKGQICLLFSVAWGFLSIFGMALENFLRRSLNGIHSSREPTILQEY